MRKASGVGRLVAAASGILALVLHLVYSLGSGGAAVPNFFSYFTMQSAMAAVIIWTVGGVLALASPVDPRWLVSARLLATTYQLVSGSVYTVIVAEAVAQGIAIQVPVSSQVLHYWMPAYALLDWLVSSGRPRVSWNVLGIVLVFPLAWGAFTMIRGALVGWYPYFFLDPNLVTSPWNFALYSGIVLAFVVAVSACLILVSRIVPLPPRRVHRSVGGKRFETASRQFHDLAVTQFGEGRRPLAADESHENR